MQKLDLSFRVLFHWFQIQQIVFDRILLTFSVPIGTKSTNAIKRIQPGYLIQLFPWITSQSLGVRVRDNKINKLIMGPNERLTEWITSHSKGLLNIILLSLKIPRKRIQCYLWDWEHIERRTKVYIACSRAHMFVSCLSYRTSLLAMTIVNNYAVTWLITMPRDMVNNYAVMCPYKN